MFSLNDAEEVSSYVAALNHGVTRIKNGFPLSLRLLREMHKILLHNYRGQHQMPGEFRKSQNWIGGSRPSNARFVPPPPDQLMEVLGDLENFMHQKDQIHPLLKAGLLHLQFETIHPFLDGNGRLGHLLITIYLWAQEVIYSPFLYLSLYFKEHRMDYDDALSAVRSSGDWETWLIKFLSYGRRNHARGCPKNTMGHSSDVCGG